MSSPYQRYLEIQSEIRSLCPDREVVLIAVSKKQPLERVESFLTEGGRIFGENTIQESIPKFQDFASRYPQWKNLIQVHHLGPVQSGTLRKLFGNFQFTHGVGSLSVLKDLVIRSEKEPSRLGYFLQVNTTDENQKNGLTPEEAISVLTERLNFETPQLFCAGLMTMGPTDEDPNRTKEAFQSLRKIRDQYFPQGKLSMGMSGDYKIALAEGSDLVRIGSAIFGDRPSPKSLEH